MKKVYLILILFLLLTGCSIVRIDTSSIDNTLNIILTKNNKLYNQVGSGYKYYLPKGVTFIDSDNQNDILYSNGVYYYLYIDTIGYYYKVEKKYKEDTSLYYSKVLDKNKGFKYSGYVKIDKIDGKELYYLTFIYNHAKIEAMVDKDNLNSAVLNSSYILSTIKYNKNIVKLTLEEGYFKNKTGKYNNYDSKIDGGNFKLVKEAEVKER